MEYGTQPGWWHDVRRLWSEYMDSRGQRVVTLTDEFVQRTPRKVVEDRLAVRGIPFPPVDVRMRIL
jgi:hypothetical protein